MQSWRASFPLLSGLSVVLAFQGAIVFGQALEPEQQATLLAERRARQSIIGEPIFVRDAENVLRRARGQGPEARYRALAAWVLPGDSHVSYRLQGAFTPDDPAPPVALPNRQESPERRSHTGGELEAPALDLVAVARQLNRLDELAERVQKVAPQTDLDRRGQLALLALIRTAQERDAEATEALQQLRPLLAKLVKGDQDWKRWPELLAAWAALRRPSLRPDAMALLDFMVVEQVQKDQGGYPWNHQVRHVRALGQWLARPESARVAFGADPQLAYWSPVVQSHADDRGQGIAPAHWTVQDGQFLHYPGHSHDYLYFNVPLQGNFEVNCELTSFGWREARVSYGGVHVGVQYDLKRADIFHYGRFLPGITIDPPLAPIGDWYNYRIVIRDGTYTAFVNGRQIHERTIPTQDPDSWLALMATGAATTGVRKLTITGTPVIPETLKLSTGPDLTGWLAEYYNESISGEAPAWAKKGEELLGRNVYEINTSPSRRFGGGAEEARPLPRFPIKQESVLQYHRPMLEDGEFSYEFFYVPGKVLVHPALDRLTFLLEPEGVAVHWMTDAQFDRTGLKPDNRTVEADRRRGPEPLPLKAGAWNLLKLKLTGDTIALFLNDTLIYERPLEPTNQRNVGLFHYADETEARVRNVTYRGAWPRKLPAAEELTGGK